MNEVLKFLEDISINWHQENDDSLTPEIVINIFLGLGIKQLDELIEAIKLYQLLNTVKTNRTVRVHQEPKIIPLSDIE